MWQRGQIGFGRVPMWEAFRGLDWLIAAASKWATPKELR
jgi:hypothetical protein